MASIRPEWQGTDQHQQALDLSRWLIHLTRSEADLISILKEGRIEARQAFGVGRRDAEVADRHRSVCFTEIPLHELKRMTADRPWGIVFDKERLRAKFGAQPVWYLAAGSPEMKAVRAAMDAARGDASSPIWALTPFIDRVSHHAGTPKYDYRWEREWRIRGDLDFDLTDVHIIVAEGEEAPEFLGDVSVGVPWMSPDDFYPTWSGGFSTGWEREIEGMLDRFRSQFETIDNSGAIWDSEDGRYYSPVEILETDEAMEEAFGHLTQDLHTAIADALNTTSFEWCRTYDLDHAGDDDDYSYTDDEPTFIDDEPSTG